jgi:hypothetical protein
MRRTPKGRPSWLPIPPKRTRSITLAVVLTLVSSQAFAHGSHNVKLHVNPKWKQCSIQLDPALTQEAWHQFTAEAGVVTYFRPLTGAEPLGRGKFEVSLLQWKTGIDAADDAWNDTFVHPDSTHWLFEGSGLKFPGLTFRIGITDRTDVGAYLTKSIGANYGFFGLQVQQNLVHDTARDWDASARLSFVTLYGPDDLDFTVFGLDLVASKEFGLFSERAFVSPYAGVSTSLSRSHEKSAVVNLEDENVWGAHGMVGAVAQFSVASIAIEYGVARVPSLSMKVGIGRK